MTNKTLTRLLAESKHISEGKAEEQVHETVQKILKKLKQGHSATLPGLGKFQPGKTTKFTFAKGGGRVKK